MKIVAVRMNQEGNITELKLDNGQQINYQQALEMVRNGDIEHVNIFHRNGREILRSEPDEDKGNNLDNLPQF